MDGLKSHMRRNVVAYLALGVALAAAGGLAYSAIPDAQGVIHGCYDNSTGALRVIDSEGSGVCRGGETGLNWNQMGPAGLQGPPGVAITYGTAKSGPVSLPAPGKTKTIATLTVPRGEYAIFGKAVGSLNVPGYTCPSGTDIYYCNLKHNERRLASTIFGCAVSAGPSSDLGRANLIAGANQLSAYQTVSANVLHTFLPASNTITLSCLQYAGGKWAARISNARLIAMKVDKVEPLDPFVAVATEIPKAAKKPKLRPLRKVLQK